MANLLDPQYFQGPLLSVNYHRQVVLGQRIADDPPAPLPGRRSSHYGTRTGPSPSGDSGLQERRSTTSLADLLAAGLITAGPGALTVSYKGNTYSATLCEDGCIVYDTRRFSSASAFSIHVKRLVTPEKQGDDGWKSVMHRGQTLDEYRHEYRQQQAQAAEAAAGGQPPGATASEGNLSEAQPSQSEGSQVAEARGGAGDYAGLPPKSVLGGRTPGRRVEGLPPRAPSVMESRADEPGSDGESDDDAMA
ncbi:hypothetical protein H632_c1317p0 [Helicosporidium sp. ATCC 50920]|nr:hypothetical protein H632_c1317p0 [Helicosporidium sp. ATCC 50920]|eukprot:KDD74434.1 hypothetical protein H632_c1317p0 [Helicosporidium sp. ATCC 50920]